MAAITGSAWKFETSSFIWLHSTFLTWKYSKNVKLMSKFRYNNRFLQKSNMAAKTGSGVWVLKETAYMFKFDPQRYKTKVFCAFDTYFSEEYDANL